MEYPCGKPYLGFTPEFLGAVKRKSLAAYTILISRLDAWDSQVHLKRGAFRIGLTHESKVKTLPFN